MTDSHPSLFSRMDHSGIPLLIFRLFLGGAFVYLSTMKLNDDPSVFLKAIKLYGVLPQEPPQFMNWIAIVMPVLELVCGLAILAGVLMRGASLIMFCMLAVFTPAIYMHGMQLFNAGKFVSFCDVKFDCGCGTGEEWVCQKIPLNLALMLAAALVFFCKSRRFTLMSLFKHNRNAT